MSRKYAPPTKEQRAFIARIGGVSGLFACKAPKTKAEASEIILNFLQPVRRMPPLNLDLDKLFVEDVGD